MPLRPIIVQGDTSPSAPAASRAVRPTLERHAPARGQPPQQPAPSFPASVPSRDAEIDGRINAPVVGPRELETAYAVVQRYLDEGRRFVASRAAAPALPQGPALAQALAAGLPRLPGSLGELADSDVGRVIAWLAGELLRAARPREAAPAAATAPQGSAYAFEPAIAPEASSELPQTPPLPQGMALVPGGPDELAPSEVNPPDWGPLEGRDSSATGTKSKSSWPPWAREQAAASRNAVNPGGHRETKEAAAEAVRRGGVREGVREAAREAAHEKLRNLATTKSVTRLFR